MIFSINLLKLNLVVTDALIFGSHYMFIFLSALIIHNDLHLAHTLDKNYTYLHFLMLLKIKIAFIINNKGKFSTIKILVFLKTCLRLF